MSDNACIYILEEFSNDARIPCQKLFLKIGVTTIGSGLDPFHHRTRKFHEGNVRSLQVVYSHSVTDPGIAKVVAAEIERLTHDLLKERGYHTRHYETKQTGHGEWFEVTQEAAIAALQDAIRFYYNPSQSELSCQRYRHIPIIDIGAFNIPEIYKRTTSNTSDYIRRSDLKIVTDLFTGL